MFQSHPVFQEPPDDATIWRYMSFAKLVSLLDTKSLWFSRLDKLEDVYEGRLPRPTYDITDDRIVQLYEMQRKGNFVNCWSVLESESVGLWKTYVPHNEGVAIRSTFAHLRDSFIAEGLFKDADVHIGLVRYIDFNKETLVPNSPQAAYNVFLPMVHKRKFFAFEAELRAVISSLGNSTLAVITPQVTGLRVPVVLENLVLGVHVAPEAPFWLVEAVKSVIQGYGLKPEIVVQSSLDDPLGRE